MINDLELYPTRITTSGNSLAFHNDNTTSDNLVWYPPAGTSRPIGLPTIQLNGEFVAPDDTLYRDVYVDPPRPVEYVDVNLNLNYNFDGFTIDNETGNMVPVKSKRQFFTKEDFEI